jgi:hypothetical protein
MERTRVSDDLVAIRQLCAIAGKPWLFAMFVAMESTPAETLQALLRAKERDDNMDARKGLWTFDSFGMSI